MKGDRVLATNSQVPEGYKQTEVGVIPEDWEDIEIGQLNPFVTSGSRGWAEFYSNYGYPFIRITNMTRESISLDLDDLRYVELPDSVSEGKRTQLQNDDLLVSITADVGIISYVDDKLQKPAYINQHIALIRFDEQKVNSRFLSYFLSHENAQKWFRGGTDQGAKAGMSLIKIRQIKAALPPIAEQNLIASALSDTDALIESLEQLLAKKRQIKQGAMQELLTGKRRVEGFDSKWKALRFEDLVTLRRERIDPRKKEIQFFCVELEHIDSATGLILGSTVTHEQSSLKSVFYSGDILFGKLRAYLRKYWWANRSGVCSTEIWVFSPKENLTLSSYLFQIVKTDDFIESASSSYGTHMPRSDWNVVKQFEVLFPSSLEEQTAIATILSDMDLEIGAIATKLTKARQLKQGMMHELLTGRIRLIEGAPS
jgi:type I restriction enzyme, S subunit